MIYASVGLPLSTSWKRSMCMVKASDDNGEFQPCLVFLQQSIACSGPDRTGGGGFSIYAWAWAWPLFIMMQMLPARGVNKE